MGKPAGQLTTKMLSFIDAYVGAACGNAYEAYKMSMYSGTGNETTVRTQAQKTYNLPQVKAEIERRLKARSDRVEELMAPKIEVTPDRLISKLFQIIEAEQERNPNAALRAIELAGKSIALWKERQEITGADGEAIKHEQHVKESVADFTSKLEQLKSRRDTGSNGPQGTDNVVSISDRRAEG